MTIWHLYTLVSLQTFFIFLQGGWWPPGVLASDLRMVRLLEAADQGSMHKKALVSSGTSKAWIRGMMELPSAAWLSNDLALHLLKRKDELNNGSVI